MAADFGGIVGPFAGHGVEAIIIGGLAAQAHGAARLTQDVDFLYRRAAGNIDRLAAALAPHAPYPRGAPEGLPFHFDSRTIHAGLNFTLTTALGDVVLLGEMTGGGTDEQVLPHSVELQVFGRPTMVVGLEALIRAKRAAGRRRISRPSPSWKRSSSSANETEPCATPLPRRSGLREPSRNSLTDRRRGL